MEASLKEIELLALEYFDVKGSLQKLPGEEDYNFYLKTNKDEEFTLKKSRLTASEESIAFQASILRHLKDKDFELSIPSVIPSLQGHDFVKLEDDTFLRLQKWVPGKMLADVLPKSEYLLKSWGRTAASLSKALIGYDHPGAHRFYKWNPAETLHSKKHLEYFANDQEKEIGTFFWTYFEKKIKPKLGALRKSVNYCDAHEYNLLVNREGFDFKISGVIDFGDALYTETINELAIACAYACMSVHDPLAAAVHVVGSYHQVFALEEKELDILYGLIAARLMITVANAAEGKHKEPENKYLLISEIPAWDLLKKWRKIPPDLAHCTFRFACGFDPSPKRAAFDLWKVKGDLKMENLFQKQEVKFLLLDLSVGSSLLGNNENFEDIQKFEKLIQRHLEDHDNAIGIGGYAEVRPFYTTDEFQTTGNEGPEWRTVHLGTDLWAAESRKIFAPLEGRIHSFQNNEGDCNYGPTIILHHKISEDLEFYSLYGHLSLESIQGKKIGQVIKKGELLAQIGAREVNGNWPPHLHFQIILDLFDYEGDFPGVAFPNDKEVWLSNSPNPAIEEIRAKPIMDSKEMIAARQHTLGPNLSLSYQKPLHIIRGFKQYLYDQNGRRYLDTCNNVPHVGHQHPRVVETAKKQIGLLNTNTRYLHENIIQFAEDFLATFPSALEVVYFVNSGSEANELALRMTKTYTKQKDMFAIEVGYHGNTGAVVDVSSYKFDGKGGQGAPAYTHLVPIPDVYRGIYTNPETAGLEYANHLKFSIDKIKTAGRSVAGFICESILSCGGQIVLPNNFLKHCFEYIRAEGGLCIMDEVQVGLGRVGNHFWGFELQDVIPDIVTIGKPIGNGHPLAAVVCTRAVADAFNNGMEYFNTFGGNPVSCAIGHEVLKIVQEEKLQENAYEIGGYLKQGLENLKASYPVIGDVRGHGFFLGMELVKDRNTLAAAANECTYLANRMRERGFLMSTDGPLHNVIKIKPPMCFTKANADELLSNIKHVLKEDFMQA